MYCRNCGKGSVDLGRLINLWPSDGFDRWSRAFPCTACGALHRLPGVMLVYVEGCVAHLRSGKFVVIGAGGKERYLVRRT